MVNNLTEARDGVLSLPTSCGKLLSFRFRLPGKTLYEISIRTYALLNFRCAGYIFFTQILFYVIET
jgi:hypothetical protein